MWGRIEFRSFLSCWLCESISIFRLSSIFSWILPRCSWSFQVMLLIVEGANAIVYMMRRLP